MTPTVSMAGRGEDLIGLLLAAQVDRVDDGEGAPPDRLGNPRDGGEAHQPGGGGELIGQPGLGQVPPGVQDRGGRVDRPPQQPGAGLGDREQPHFHRGDHGETSAAAAQRPEQVALVVRVGADQPPVRGHGLDGSDAAGGQAVLAA
jgi:hypothetical protein